MYITFKARKSLINYQNTKYLRLKAKMKTRLDILRWIMLKLCFAALIFCLMITLVISNVYLMGFGKEYSGFNFVFTR